MPRISELQTIKNSALAKLDLVHNLIDGRTAAAYRRRIFSVRRKDYATKLLEDLNSISTVPTSSVTKKLT